MTQSNPIQVNNFQGGIATSPYVGFGKMIGLDIFRKPGIIQCNTRLVNFGSNTVGTFFTGLVTAQVLTPDGALFQATNNGKVYRNGTDLGVSRGNIHDMVYIQDYIVIVGSTGVVDLYGPVSVGGSYISNWQTITIPSVTNGYMKATVDGTNIYISSYNNIAKIAGFSAGTGVLTQNKLATNTFLGRTIQTMVGYSRYIAVMASDGYSSALYFVDTARIDPDGVSLYVSRPVPIQESKVVQMINYNNRLYFFGNDTGTLYITNQVSYSPVAMLPNRLQTQSYNLYNTPNSICVSGNEILLGIGGTVNSAFDVVYGVYAFRNNSLVCKSIISTGGYGQTNVITFGSIISIVNDSYQVSWQDGTTYGVDQSNLYIATGFNAWFESPFYETGTAIKPRTFQTVQFNFASNMVDGQRLRLKYRIASNQDWVKYADYSYNDNTLTMTFYDSSGAVTNTTTSEGLYNTFHSDFPVTNTTNMQIRVEFDTSFGITSALYGTNIELQSITLI